MINGHEYDLFPMLGLVYWSCVETMNLRHPKKDGMIINLTRSKYYLKRLQVECRGEMAFYTRRPSTKDQWIELGIVTEEYEYEFKQIWIV